MSKGADKFLHALERSFEMHGGIIFSGLPGGKPARNYQRDARDLAGIFQQEFVQMEIARPGSKMGIYKIGLLQFRHEYEVIERHVGTEVKQTSRPCSSINNKCIAMLTRDARPPAKKASPVCWRRPLAKFPRCLPLFFA